VNLEETRNTFCGTWYLPHSEVHHERTVPIIVAVRIHETAIFPRPLLNLTSPSCSSTPISKKPRKLAIRVHLRQI